MQNDITLSRRGFVKGGIVIGSSVIFAGAVAGTAIGADEAAQNTVAEGVQYGFLVNISKCVGCRNCVAACRKGNDLSEDTPDRRVVSAYSNDKDIDIYVSTACMHCAEPSCERVCPSGAITKGDAGIVSTNKDRCIGCKYCYQACPYGVPNYNSVAMDKCDCCLDVGITPGETPFCVQACMFNALKYGPMEELLEMAHGEAKPVGEENNPSCLLTKVGGRL